MELIETKKGTGKIVVTNVGVVGYYYVDSQGNKREKETNRVLA